MQNKSFLRVKKRNGRNQIVFCFLVLLAAMLFCGRAVAFEIEFLGKPLNLNGYINQGIQFGVAGDHYDTKAGFQQALMQALLEADYYVTNDLKIFVSGYLNIDWAYKILENNDEWEFRQFDKSDDKLFIYDEYEDYLKECHVSWTPGDFNFRVGKQIVPWGRMTAIRVMDLINPVDRRRGFADVEFETSIIPIWLVKAEYYPDMRPPFLNEVGLEFIFNPNADFIPNKDFSTGNDVHGIWAADSLVEIAPGYFWRVGSQDFILEEPDAWNSDGYEYGFRIKGMLPDSTYFTLNYFDGIQNAPVVMPTGGYRLDAVTDDKGRTILHPEMAGFYADQRNAGFTVAHELTSLYSNFLGGVAPLARAEALYEFDTTFATDGRPGSDRFEEYDAIHWGMSMQWKIKIPKLNPRRYFDIEPGFIHRHIRDYPSDYELFNASKNLYSITVLAQTQYLHDKLAPSLVYMRQIKGSVGADMWRIKLDYLPNSTWKYSVQLYMLEGEGFDAVDHKDNISFTVQYQF